MAWVLLDAFSQVYSEDWEKIPNRKDLRNLHLGQKSQRQRLIKTWFLRKPGLPRRSQELYIRTTERMP